MIHTNVNRNRASIQDANDDRVNKAISQLLLAVAAVALVLHILSEFNLFGTKNPNSTYLLLAGSFVCLSPVLLSALHVKRKILKGYILVVSSVGVFCCALFSIYKLEMLFLAPVLLASLYASPVICVVSSGMNYLLFYTYTLLRNAAEARQPVFSPDYGDASGQKMFFLEFIILCLIFTLISEISRRKLISEEVSSNMLRESRMLYNIAVENSSDIIFEYDLKSDTMQLFGNVSWNITPEQDVTDKRHIKGFLKNFLNSPGLSRNDRDRVKAFFSAQNVKTFEIKIENVESGDSWLRISGSGILEFGEIKKIVGKISDITRSKRAEFEEQLFLSRDSVTHLPIEDVAKSKINEYLFRMKQDELAAVFAIHADNFNGIEKEYGIIFANTVLEQTANLLRNLFEEDDIIYRCDDLTFIVFAKKLRISDVDKYSVELLRRVNEIYTGEKKDISFGFSIGHVTTDRSTYFEQLLKWALKACAGVIMDGGSEARSYNDGLACIAEREIINHSGEIMSYNAVYNSDDIIAYSYALLERTKDVKSGMMQLLTRIGSEFDFVTVEINDADEESLSVMNSYFWTKHPGKYEPEMISFNSKADFQSWVSLFNEDEGYEHNSVYFDYIEDSLKDAIRKNMPSKLGFAIYDEGSVIGEISFSKEDPAYNWPSDVKITLRELARIIATHIVKQKADNASRAKSDFLSNMSHEIRTPMNAICGMTELILGTPLSAEAVDYASTIKASASNLLGIINDILDFSKIESGKMEVIPDNYQFASMMHEIISIINVRLNDKNVSLVVDFDKEIPCGLYGDEMRIRQILINLLNNAVKFTEKGTITLSARWEKQTIDRGIITFSVKDTGIGIKPEDLTKLFSAFTRVDEKRNRKTEGTGLGLSISKKLVDIMDGKIWVDSTYGEGSIFAFSIPQIVNDPTPSNFDGKRSVMQSGESVSQKPKFTAPEAKLLVVDDNAVNLRVASGLMSKWKPQISVALSGYEAISLIEEGNEYDIIFMDHMMPDMDGVETTHRIREMHTAYTSTVPIVALTANAIKGVEKMFLESGFNGYLSKPIEVEKLAATLKNFIPAEKQIKSDDRNDPQEESRAAEELEESIRLFDTLRTISEIDTEAGLKNNGGIIKNYYEIVNVYVSAGKKDYENAQKYYETGDIKNYTITVHGIKSASRGIGASELGEEAYALELAGKDNNLEFIEANHAPFMKHYMSVMEDICDKLGLKNSSEREEISDDALKEALNAALPLLDEMDDVGAMEAVKPVLNGIYSHEEIEGLMSEIAEDIDNLDCDIAAEKINKILELIS